jgi:hypothetical protein
MSIRVFRSRFVAAEKLLLLMLLQPLSKNWKHLPNNKKPKTAQKASKFTLAFNSSYEK